MSPNERRSMQMPPKMKKLCIILSVAFILCISVASLIVGYAGGVRGAGLVGVWFFTTFGIVVVLAQLIPAGIIAASFAATLFRSARKTAVPMRTA
jgi:hypothetical protein